MSALSEFIFEYTSLEWIGEPRCPVDPNPPPQQSPEDPPTEREPFSYVVLVSRMFKAIRQFNCTFPLRALPTLLGMLLSGELSMATRKTRGGGTQ